MSQFRIAHDFVHCTLSALAIGSTKVTPHSCGAPERKAALRKVLRRMWVQEIDGRTFRDYLMLSWANWSQMCPAAGCRNTRRLRLATERGLTNYWIGLGAPKKPPAPIIEKPMARAIVTAQISSHMDFSPSGRLTCLGGFSFSTPFT